MSLVRAVTRAVAAVSVLVVSTLHVSPVGAEGVRRVPTTAAQDLAARVMRGHDHRGRPFAIVDKKASRVFVYAADGELRGGTAALLGMARGDHAVAGLGALPPARIPPAQRTTPAGRFATEPGRNLDGEDVIWFDYDAGLAIHRLRQDAALRARERRLAAGEPHASRVSAGCVVVPVAFYEQVVRPVLGQGRGVIYVLPETREGRDMLAAVGREDGELPF